jgi:hypothetical protein
MTHTILLATQSGIYDLYKLQMATTNTPTGACEVCPEIAKMFGEGAAKNLNGTLVRTWHDRGLFAEIEVA